MLDVELYGGKRGLLEHARASVLYAVGIYRPFCDINWAKVGRLAFVCSGNICRSPYASARARALGIPAVSFGLRASDGSPADPVASRNALLRGVDLAPHRSARARLSAFAKDDLIIVFEPAQLSQVHRHISREIPVSLLGVWSQPRRPHVQDPYGRGDRYFQECFSVIDANVAALGKLIAGSRVQALENTRQRPRDGNRGDASYDRTPV